MKGEPASQAADAALTASRDEQKYVLRPEHAARFVQTVTRQLTPHRFVGEGASRLPRARHYVTTVYFDTPDRELYAAAKRSDSNIKLRAREYYDLHPELAELATSARELVRYSEVLWIELKFKDGTHTRKRRIGIPKHEVPRFFDNGAISAEMRALQAQAHGEEADQVLDELMRFRSQFDAPLSASCLVNYRRKAFQDPAGHLRVTLDRQLSSFAPPSDLWTREHALLRETLGPCLYQEANCVIEVKSRGSVPAWLSETLQQVGARLTPYSKFIVGSEATAG